VRVEAVFVGTELLEGRLNTHLVELAKRFAPLGLALARTATVGDDPAEIERAVREALDRSSYVLVFGGLGPTFDDLTREGTARALGRGLEFRPELLAEIRRKFARRRVRMAPMNRRQAYLVQGGRAVRNNHGSAPGQRVDAGRGRSIYLLPGPESEMVPMLERAVLPELSRAAGDSRPAKLEFHCGGLIESEADRRLRPILAGYPKANFTILSSRGLVSFYATAPTARGLAGLRAKVLRVLGRHVFAEGASSLAAAVGRRLLERKEKLSVAESCTGGLVAEQVTKVPGSSNYFTGGLVSYDNRVKLVELGVPRRILDEEGAVSAACAEAMADGARLRFATDWAVSVTGIAGPDGGTKAKPVGTVFIALAGPDKTASRRYWLSGDRNEVRHKAANAALFWLWDSLR
jgi:nicotinamide-nucleotide amidase